jgi:hypothetical protein
MRLSLNEYKSILKYYNIDITGMKQSIIRKQAEDILAEKLCRCIKAVDKSKAKTKSNREETKAIAICKNSIFTKKNLKISKFTCKKKIALLNSKKSKKLVKTSRKLRL